MKQGTSAKQGAHHYQHRGKDCFFHICSNLVLGYSVYLQEARTRII